MLLHAGSLIVDAGGPVFIPGIFSGNFTAKRIFPPKRSGIQLRVFTVCYSKLQYQISLIANLRNVCVFISKMS